MTSTDWGESRPVPRWPKPGPDEPVTLYNAEWQDYDGFWTVLATAVPHRQAQRVVRDFRRTFIYPHYPPETRVKEFKEGATR